jgi:hypothetical protein
MPGTVTGAPVDARDDDAGARLRQVDRLRQGAVAPGGLDHQVVAAVAGLDRAETFTGGALGVVARHQRHLASACPRRGDGAEPDGAAADHGDALVGPHGRAPQRVHDDGQRLDERRVTDVDAGGQRYETPFGHDDLIGHAAVAPDAVQHRTAPHAEVFVAPAARLALPARIERFDGHRCAVLGDAGDLVAERDGRWREVGAGDQVQVAAADARRPDVDHHARPVGRRHVADLDRPVARPNRPHRQSAGSRTNTRMVRWLARARYLP